MRNPLIFPLFVGASLLLATEAPCSGGQGYIGAAACSGCHVNVARLQSRSRMALTLPGPATTALPPDYHEQIAEGTLAYRADRKHGRMAWQLQKPEATPITLPVETVVGADRHGLSFLARLSEVGGIPLSRAPLVEARYLHSSTEGKLVLSPGFPPEQPSSLDTALGRVLSASFEKKCLSCHGSLEAGIHCETCHGPGQPHLLAVSKGTPRAGIVNPARFSNERKMELCGQCHAGFSPVSDPLPDDLLISSQVTALRNTECYVQSGAALSCTTCHDPHRNASEQAASYDTACLQCHAAGGETRHAAICPVNQKEGCVGCHMPARTRGPFHMVDHWIRVVSETPGSKASPRPEFRSQIEPVRLFLRILSVKEESLALDLQRKLASGASFFELATKYSTDASAQSGGYLGEMKLADLDPALREAVEHLAPGAITAALPRPGGFAILGRMPRDFRWRAGAIAEEASKLRVAGKLDEAATKYLEALRGYPYLLRALIFLGVTRGQQGNGAQAYGILDLASRLYPDDPAGHYNLGIALGAMGRTPDEIEQYRRAIALEPDLVPAYLNLGAALFASGQVDPALEAYRKGLDVNPLSAQIYFSLAAVLKEQGHQEESARAMKLAAAINPEFVRQQSAPK